MFLNMPLGVGFNQFVHHSFLLHTMYSIYENIYDKIERAHTNIYLMFFVDLFLKLWKSVALKVKVATFFNPGFFTTTKTYYVSKVMEAMKNDAKAPTAFSLKTQYVPVVCAAAEAAGQGPDADDQDPNEGPGSTSTKRKQTTEGCDGEKPKWNYNHHRMNFINHAKKEHGMTYAEAQKLWDASSEKADLLGVVSVQELKKRRFISKDVFENPWAKK